MWPWLSHLSFQVSGLDNGLQTQLPSRARDVLEMNKVGPDERNINRHYCFFKSAWGGEEVSKVKKVWETLG